MPGEVECGDQVLVVSKDDAVLLAVVDGLGHGPLAAVAAREACAHIEAHSDESLTDIMRGTHKAITRTRGAVVTLVRIAEKQGTMRHAGIGNVEVSGLSRDRIHPVCIPGIVGASLRKVVENRFNVSPGDILVIHTDGISRRFNLEEYRNLPAQQIADALIRDLGKDHDDASCITLCF